MLSVIGEEYVAYSESVKGQYAPIIAISRYDGTVTFREVIKDDLLRINDEKNIPGGWLFRKTQNASASWVKRFVLLRGDFLFMFHSPQNEKPIAVVPLDCCTVVPPEQNEKSFDEIRTYRANEGYEFDIRHPSRPTVRLYALSDEERAHWIVYCRERISDSAFAAQQEKKSGLGSHSVPATFQAIAAKSNITMSSTKLSGLSLLPTDEAATSSIDGSSYRRGLYNHSANYVSGGSGNNPVLAAVAGSITGTVSPSPPTHLRAGQLGQSPPGTRTDDTTASPIATVADASITGHGNGHGNGGNFGAEADDSGSDSAPPPPPLPNVKKIHERNLGFDIVVLEENLQKKLSEQLEARKRENLIRSKLNSSETIQSAQAEEQQNPVTLAELFRLCLFFIDEEVAEDPQKGTPLQMPHLKGHAIEDMLMTVYQRYCGDSGFMSLEEFIEFLDDSAILQTHVPHNENDEPLEEFVTLLDPVRLLTLVPRNIGFTSAESYDVVNEKLNAAVREDKFIINFSQFYLMLLRITQIVYANIYEKDATLAFNKVLLEVILPLFVWSKGRYKRGSRDVLVLEERILLLLVTYAPNLWRVYLTYSQDAVGKVPEVNLPFPDFAQSNEKGMFKLPPAAPLRIVESAVPVPESVYMSESGCLRFARDYGLTPFVVSNKQLRELCRGVNRQKVIVSSRLPAPMVQGGLHSKAQIDLQARKKKAAAPMKFNSKAIQQAQPKLTASVAAGGRKGAAKTQLDGSPEGKTVQPFSAGEAGTMDAGSDDELPPPPPPPLPAAGGVRNTGMQNTHNVGGIGFSEFMELIARVAVEGMKQENYHVVFPTPFSKVLAILTVWGVADLKKLEDVRIIHTDEMY